MKVRKLSVCVSFTLGPQLQPLLTQRKTDVWVPSPQGAWASSEPTKAKPISQIILQPSTHQEIWTSSHV